jgi:hypothetical protein
MPEPKRARFHIGPAGPEVCHSGCPRGWDDAQHYRSHHLAQAAYEADPAAFPPLFQTERPQEDDRTWEQILAELDEFLPRARSFVLTELYEGRRSERQMIANVRPDLAFDHVVEQLTTVPSAELDDYTTFRERLAAELRDGTSWEFTQDVSKALAELVQPHRSALAFTAYTSWFDEHAAGEPEVAAEIRRRASLMRQRWAFLTAVVNGIRIPDDAARAFERRWAAGNPHPWSREGFLHKIRGVEQQLRRLAQHTSPDQAANEMGHKDAATAFDDLQKQRRRLMYDVTKRGRDIREVVGAVIEETGVFTDGRY